MGFYDKALGREEERELGLGPGKGQREGQIRGTGK